MFSIRDMVHFNSRHLASPSRVCMCRRYSNTHTHTISHSFFSSLCPSASQTSRGKQPCNICIPTLPRSRDLNKPIKSIRISPPPFTSSPKRYQSTSQQIKQGVTIKDNLSLPSPMELSWDTYTCPKPKPLLLFSQTPHPRGGDRFQSTTTTHSLLNHPCRVTSLVNLASYITSYGVRTIRTYLRTYVSLTHSLTPALELEVPQVCEPSNPHTPIYI